MTPKADMTLRNRRTLLSLFALLPLAGLPASAQKPSTALRIGYQKSSTLLTIVNCAGGAGAAPGAAGVKVSWHEFRAACLCWKH
jgi:sulfonate transport system substrate-binding protein